MRLHALALTAALFTGLTLQSAPQAFSSHPDLSAPDALSMFTLDGSGTWEIKDQMLVLAKAGTPGGPIRRPSALAVLQSEPLVRATVQVEMRSTAPEEVKNRDLEIIFGYESPRRFYYVHLAGITDANHNGIFLVDNKDRRRIDDGTAAPQLKDREWHRVRLERDRRLRPHRGLRGRLGAGRPARHGHGNQGRPRRPGLVRRYGRVPPVRRRGKRK